MAAAGGYAVKFSAVDGISSRIDAINKRLRSMQAPVEKLNRRVAELAERTGFARMGRVVSDLTQRVVGLASGLARVIPAMGAITGAASLAGMYRLVSDWAEFGRQVAFSARNIGISAEQLSGLQGAAQLAGSSAGSLTSGLQTLGQTMYDAIGGRNPEAVVMFRTIGVAFRDAAGHARSVADVMPEVADKIAAMKNPYSQARVAAELFGGAAGDLLPFLRQGSAGIARYNAMAVHYGVVNARAAKAASDFAEDQTRVKLAFVGLGNSIAETVEPVLGPLLVQFAEFINSNRELIATRLAEYIKRLGIWLKTVDFDKIKQDIRDFCRSVDGVAQKLGGWQSVAKDLMIFMGGKWALGVLAPFVKISNAIGAEIAELLLLAAGWTGVGKAADKAAASEIAATAAAAAKAEWAASKKIATMGAAEEGGGLLAALGLGGRIATPLGAFLATLWGGGLNSGEDADLARIRREGGDAGFARGGMPYGYVAPNVGANDGGHGSTISSSAAVETYNALRRVGLDRKEALAVEANYIGESDLRTDTDTQGHYGLAQWSPERQADFRRWFGHDIHGSSRDEQIAFTARELSQRYPGVLAAMKAAKTASEAGAIFSHGFEVSGIASDDSRRGGIAAALDQRIPADAPPLTLSPAAAGGRGGGGANAAPASGTANINVHVTGNTDGVRTTARTAGTLFPQPPTIVTSMPTGAP